MDIQTVICSKQYRVFDIELYDDCKYFYNGIVVQGFDIIDYIINGSSNLIEYAYIVHDKDIDDNGELKKIHVHMYLRYKNGRTIQSISNVYGIPYTNFALYKHFKKQGKEYIDTGSYEEPNRKLRLRYLCHLDNPEKYQYDSFEVVTNITDFCFFGEGDVQRAIDDLVDYGINHSWADTWEYAKKYDLRNELKSVQWIIDKVRRETDFVIEQTTKMYKQVMSSAQYRALYNEALSVFEDRYDNQHGYFYDEEGNVIGCC